MRTFCLECVSKIKSILLSIIYHEIYGAVRIQLTHFSYDDCENTCTLSYYHHQIGSITHLPLSMVRSWNNGVRCMTLYICMHIYFYRSEIWVAQVVTVVDISVFKFEYA